MLTPLAVDPAHPFPYISGLSLNLAVVIRNPEDRQGALRPGQGAADLRPVRAARATSGSCRSRTSSASTSSGSSPAWRCSRSTPSGSPATRTSRSRRTTPRTCSPRWRRSCCAAGSARRCGSRSRSRSTPHVLELLVSELGVTEEEVFRLPGPLDLRGLHGIADLDREELKYPAFVPTTHRAAGRGRVRQRRSTCSRRPRAHDVLLHHPYDSFATRCSASSSRPPPTRTCWRSSRRSTAPPATRPIIDALIDAAEAGKQVLVLVEIKARFDEQANIRWARKLEQAGCHVVYGLVGLKTHCKLALVVRDEPDGHPPLRPHRHRQLQPQDRPASTRTSGCSPPTRRSARTSPTCSTTCRGCSRNASYDAAAGRARLGAQRAARADPRARSSTTGPAARRGSGSRPTRSSTRRSSTRSTAPRRPACRSSCWSAASARCGPACPGCRRRSRSASILGRFLEHSRIFWFENGGEPEAWIGSADLMHRNLDRRVEVLVRLPGEDNVDELGELLDLAFDRGHRRLGARQRRRLAPQRRRRSTSRRP